MTRRKAPAPPERAQGAKARMAAIVIIVTMVLWMGASFLGGQAGLPARYAFLIDFAALAAFFWALVVLWQVWQARQRDGDS
jgi:ABC-type transport system involved in cytochrome bd biosynthesis fused ATPase/permease subunit